MGTVTLVAEARLYSKDSPDLYDYFDDYVGFFCFLLRKVIHNLRHQLNGQPLSAYRTRLKKDFKLTNRTAKALTITAKNLLKLHKEAMVYLYQKRRKKKRKLMKKIKGLKSALDKTPTPRLKIALYKAQTDLNQLNQILSKGVYFQLTLGRKDFFKSDMGKFLRKRDNQFVFIGDKNETKGNQQFQLSFDSKRNRFTYKARYENNWIKDHTYYFGSFALKNKDAKTHIRKALDNPKSAPLSYRIIRKGNYLYLQIMYRQDVIDVTRDSYGVLGVDFNKGFISVSEIDENGKLESLNRYYYRPYGPATVTSNSMFEMVKELVKQARESGKDIAVEDLKSLDDKKTEKSGVKNYNRMLNSLKFGRFKKYLTQKCSKEGVGLHFVNPYNTSQIAKENYCKPMKLNVHDGASFTIARRHYGLN